MKLFINEYCNIKSMDDWYCKLKIRNRLCLLFWADWRYFYCLSFDLILIVIICQKLQYFFILCLIHPAFKLQNISYWYHDFLAQFNIIFEFCMQFPVDWYQIYCNWITGSRNNQSKPSNFIILNNSKNQDIITTINSNQLLNW